MITSRKDSVLASNLVQHWTIVISSRVIDDTWEVMGVTCSTITLIDENTNVVTDTVKGWLSLSLKQSFYMPTLVTLPRNGIQ